MFSRENVKFYLFFKDHIFHKQTVLPSLIISQQTADVQNRYIGEAGRLISDILHISDKLCINGYLVTVDIDKAFDSDDHGFF